MTQEEREALIEAVTSAFRPRDPITGEVRGSDAWQDLDEVGRVEAFERGLVVREMEAGMDAEELSTTARAVLARILRRG
ncbi:MAG TPA: hypothetical protein VJV78_11730 [Polyangiales bacterium]|nr:hypothetical protein [Polyangiales bacterium]